MNNRMPDECELVIGVDTHKHVHTAAALDATTGGQRQLIELTNDRAGYAALYEQIPDRPRVWAIEGAGGYGAGLARWLIEQGETVVEVERPKRAVRRNGAKSDPIELRRLARRIRDLEDEAAEHETALRRLVADWRPDLLEVQGVGPIVAATLLCAWSHPGRIRSEAAFAQLAGVAPIPASSGQTTRYRLSRFGDRQLNRALHTVTLTRLQRDPTTRAYAERRRAEGKTDREIKRCLKRYIARQIYRQLENGPPTGTA